MYRFKCDKCKKDSVCTSSTNGLFIDGKLVCPQCYEHVWGPTITSRLKGIFF